MLLLYNPPDSYSDTLSTNTFFPLSVGNRFYYNRYSYSWPGPPGSNSLKYISVDSEKVFQGMKFFYVRGGIYNDWFRLDSLTGSLYMYDSQNSCSSYYYCKLRDSLRAELNQQIFYCTVGSPNTCNSKGFSTLFGTNVAVIGFRVSSSNQTHNRKYTDKFGPLHTDNSYSSGHVGYYESDDLIGCLIDGVLYGDSTLVGIESEGVASQKSYFLHPNYPNPFNPVTRITFEIARGGKVELTVYDVAGKEVSRLFSEEMSPGRYEKEFDGSNLSSGVYFYRLSAQDFVATRKMILLK